MKVDLVLAKYEEKGINYLFQAPYISRLKKGDLVDVEGGTKFATVVAVRSICETSNSQEDYNFITQMHGVKLPLKKVIAKVRLDTYLYEEGINE